VESVSERVPPVEGVVAVAVGGVVAISSVVVVPSATAAGVAACRAAAVSVPSATARVDGDVAVAGVAVSVLVGHGGMICV